MRRVLNLVKKGVKWYLKQTYANGYIITPTGCIPLPKE